MRKKLLMAVLISVFLSLVLWTRMWAGDLPEALLQIYDVDILLCTVTETENEEMTVCIDHSERNLTAIGTVLRVERRNLPFEMDEDQQMVTLAPNVGDRIVLNVKNDAQGFTVYWWELCGFITSAEDDHIQLNTCGLSMMERFNDYLNDGRYASVPLTQTKPGEPQDALSAQPQSTPGPIEADVQSTQEAEAEQTRFPVYAVVFCVLAVGLFVLWNNLRKRA